MAKVSETFSVELSRPEAECLKAILGSFNDPQFAQFGVTGELRQAFSDLWSDLPYPIEED